jgi:alanine transaminase
MGMLQSCTEGLQLISFHSVSKGFLGECGLRGGYFEINGVPEDVSEQIIKLASISLCSNTVGQVAVGLMVQPPKQGEPSFEQYLSEKTAILDSLKRRAVKLVDCLNQLDGVECTESEGALYAFPTVNLPAGALAAAAKEGVAPDAFYCSALLESTGIVTVPGSGFKQVEGTNHFRITILPPEEELDTVFSNIGTFHSEFMKQYA